MIPMHRVVDIIVIIVRLWSLEIYTKHVRVSNIPSLSKIRIVAVSG